MANDIRREYNLVPQEVTETVDVIVTQDQLTMEDQVVDGQVQSVEVVIQVPVTVQRDVTRIVQVMTEQDIPLTDEEQAEVNATRAAALTQQLSDALEAHRFEVETGGITYGKNTISTDRETQGYLLGASIKAAANPAYTINSFKDDDGNWITLDADQIKELEGIMSDFVEKCFDTEKAISQKLSGYTTVQDMIIDFDAMMKK